MPAPVGGVRRLPLGRGSLLSRLSAFDWVFALLVVVGAGYAFHRYGASMDVYETWILAGAVPSLIAIGWFSEQLLDGVVRQHATIEQRVENRVVQRLHGALFRIHVARAAEAAREQQVGQLRQQLLEVDALEVVAGEAGVLVPHR